MLRDKDAATNLAVKDLPRARQFYENVLGLAPLGTEGEELVAYRSGNSKLFVYRSKEAGTNRATALTWEVGDELDAIVRALKDKGVSFEHYDMPGMTLEGDVHAGYDMRIAWFKDPDGNILSVVSG